MNRRTNIAIASLLAVLAAVVPLVGIALYARHSAARDEKRHLEEYAGWTLKRSERGLDLARGALAEIAGEGFTTCSPAHIARMRELTLETRSVEEIGYFVDGRLACTSWGPVQQVIKVGPPEVPLTDGYGLDLKIHTKLSAGMKMNALRYGDYNALMHPERMVDVLTDSAMTLGIVSLEGKMIASTGPVPTDVLARVTRADGTGQLGRFMYAATDDGKLRGFAMSDYGRAGRRADGDLWFLVPLGLAMSALLVGLVIFVSRQRISPRVELASAVRRGEFTVVYQPIIALATGLCVGAEALVRWQRFDGTTVAPDQFIPLAEETGLIEPLTDLVIARVVADLGTWLGTDSSIHVAINISSCDMQSGRFLGVLAEALAEANIAPEQIWLEATERGFMDAAAASATIERARAAGHFVAIDDFGTGYSSLSLLETLPLDSLKIDKAFVDAIGTQAATSVVIPHIIEMGHGLGFAIVAEGVETEAQEAYLRKAGVEYAQGWLYSRPLAADDLCRFHASRNAGHTLRGSGLRALARGAGSRR